MPAKKAKSKRMRKPKTLSQRERRLRDYIEDAMEQNRSAAHFKHMANDLMAQALTYLSIAEGKAENCEPMIMWDDDPLAGLHHAVGAYAEFTKTPLDELVGSLIGKIEPSAPFYWN